MALLKARLKTNETDCGVMQISLSMYHLCYVLAVTNPWLAVLRLALAQGKFDEASQTLMDGMDID